MAVALEAEEVIAAFDQKAEEAAAAVAAGETLERGSFFAVQPGGEAEAAGGGGGGQRRTEVLQTSPDDEMAAARVRAMQAVLKAYLSDSPQLVDAPFPDGFDSLDDDDDDDDARLATTTTTTTVRVFDTNRPRRGPPELTTGRLIRTVASPPRINSARVWAAKEAARPSWRRLPSSGGGART